MTLPNSFLTRPLAHRALHGAGRPENSLAAVQAAIDAGYGIEIDVQPSRDGVAMVFHDYDLRRLTPDSGAIAQRSTAELAAIPLWGGNEPVPTLKAALDLIAGRVPLLIEIKDQDGALGANLAGLEQAVVRDLADYAGDAAIMSFNPHSVQTLSRITDRPLGLVTCDFTANDWPMVAAPTRERLAQIPDYDHSDACFISHDRRDLANPRVAQLKTEGVPVLCWTVRNTEQEVEARKIADNITFEGYRPADDA